MKTQNCSKCQTLRPFTDFHKDKRRPSGISRYCKPCKKAYDRHGFDPKHKEKYVVYYLPKHRYVGMTFNLRRRIGQHVTKEKRNVEGYKVLLASKSKRIAHLLETFLHIIGFNGFRY